MEKKEYKYFEVCVKCGHVGKNKYIDKVVPVMACSAKEAAANAKAMPRVKHDAKDAIRYVLEISMEEYDVLHAIYLEDEYFHCKNIQESKRNNVYYLDEVKEETEFSYEKEEIPKKIFFHEKKKIRNPKKYFNHIKEL